MLTSTLHFQVRSVLLSRDSAAVTLEPVQWLKDDPTGKTETMGGETFPASVVCEPTDTGAEPLAVGGKMTELRLDEDTDLKPGDYLTLELKRSR